MEKMMSLKEANRLSIMRQIDKKILNIGRASEALGVSLRQAKRIRKRYLLHGEMGLISKHRGKVSPNRIDSQFKSAVIKLLQREEYTGFGPTFAMEKLRQRHGYYLSEETLRKWMIEAGFRVGGCGMDMVFHTLYSALGANLAKDWNQKYNTL